jgi:hypothetical protein
MARSFHSSIVSSQYFVAGDCERRSEVQLDNKRRLSAPATRLARFRGVQSVRGAGSERLRVVEWATLPWRELAGCVIVESEWDGLGDSGPVRPFRNQQLED